MSDQPTTPQTTLVTFLLDKSGSMGLILDDTIGAYNVYLDTLKTGDASDSIEFSSVLFDSMSVDKLYVNEPVKNVAALSRETYRPNGGTPLIDAAYKTIKAVETAIAQREAQPKVVICIQTDGQENASREHTWEELQDLIKAKTAEGWQFNFMGAGIDAYDQGARMGISKGATMSYDSTDRAATRSAFAASAMNTASFAAGASSSTLYSASQKLSAGDKFDVDLNGGQPAPGRVDVSAGWSLTGGTVTGRTPSAKPNTPAKPKTAPKPRQAAVDDFAL